MPIAATAGYKTSRSPVGARATPRATDAAGAAGHEPVGLRVDDPNDAPAGSASWAGSVNASRWYQTNSGGIGVNFSARIPPASARCRPPSAVRATTALVPSVRAAAPPTLGRRSAPSSTAPPIPAPAPAAPPSMARGRCPAAISTGTYNLNLVAANPGNYEGQGFSASGSPTVASYGNAINIDDTRSELCLGSTLLSTWTSSTTRDA